MPTLKNIIVNPDLELISDSEIEGGLHRSELRAIGLMCYTFCEARTHKAIADLPGVHRIEFVTDPDRFIVDYEPARVSFAQMRRAYNGKVKGRGLRIALGKLGDPTLSSSIFQHLSYMVYIPGCLFRTGD